MARHNFFLAFVLAILFSTPTFAQSVHGVFRVVKGDVKVIQAADGKEVKAKLGQKVFPKDTIVAGADSRAKIVMIDNNEINVSPDSKIQIQNYEYKPTEEKKNVLINVLYGKVRAKVNQKYEGDNSFQVKTPSAVAGVRGTDFFTSYDRGSKATKIVTFHGMVAFGLPGPGRQILSPVFVGVGQTTSVVGNQPPPMPVDMPKTELTQMENQSDADKNEQPGGRDAASEPNSQRDDKKKNDQNQADKQNGGPGADGAAPGGPDASGNGENGNSNSGNGNTNAANEGPGQGPAAGGEKRGPSSLPGGSDMRPGGSMLMPGDMAGAPNANVPPVLPNIGGVPVGPSPLPNLVLPPMNDFVREVIGTSRKKIIINTTIPN